MIDSNEVVRIHQSMSPVEGLAILESDEVKELTHPEVSADRLSEFSHSDNEFIQALVAANNATPADALERLSWSGNDLVLAEVVRNPNAPDVIFVRLAENPDLHPRVAMLIANSPRAPWAALERLVKAAGQDAFVKFSAMTNPRVPAEQLAEWAVSIDSLSQRATAVNPSTPSDSLAQLYKSVAQLDPMILDGVARNPNIPEWVLVEIATSALAEPTTAENGRSELSPLMRAAIQAFINPSFPHHVVPVPQGERFHSIRMNMARSPHMSESVLHQLCHDVSMHGPILHHNELPQSVLNVLLTSPHGRVRYLAASHPSLSPAFVNTLVYSEDPFVRAGAALQQSYELNGAHSVSAEWAAAAANDASATVRESVACRPDLPMEAYLSLINDPDNNVRKQALKTVDENDKWQFLSDSAVLALACDPNPDVRTIAKEYFLSGDASNRSEKVVLPWVKIGIPMGVDDSEPDDDESGVEATEGHTPADQPMAEPEPAVAPISEPDLTVVEVVEESAPEPVAVVDEVAVEVVSVSDSWETPARALSDSEWESVPEVAPVVAEESIAYDPIVIVEDEPAADEVTEETAPEPAFGMDGVFIAPPVMEQVVEPVVEDEPAVSVDFVAMDDAPIVDVFADLRISDDDQSK